MMRLTLPPSTCTTANRNFPGLPPLLRALGSLRLTLLLLLLLALSVGLYMAGGREHNLLIALPLLGLAANLLAAIAIHSAFRRNIPLLIFHLALLALVILVAFGRLTYLNGEAEVTSGSDFSGELNNIDAGPLHNWDGRLQRFHLAGFSIDYDPGVQRGATHAHVEWLDSENIHRQGIIGDHLPLVLDDYRFYTTHNKGFAARFQWLPANGRVKQTGSVHFPSYPAHELRQAQRWQLPGNGPELWSQLDFDEVILDPAHRSQFKPPREHTLVIRLGDTRHELHPGESLQLESGVLTYVELGTWMGFRVSYDWTLPWLLATGLVAVASLGWHYRRKFAAKPWLEEDMH